MLPKRAALDLPGVSTDPQTIHAAREPIGPDRLWITDVSQVWAADAWLHFAFVLDRHSRRCLGFFPHRVLHPGLVAGALEAAAAARRSRAPGSGSAPAPAIVFGRRCYSAGIEFPPWAIPAAADTAVSDAFLAALRGALLDDDDDAAWSSQREATSAIESWIERSYNRGNEPAAALAAVPRSPAR